MKTYTKGELAYAIGKVHNMVLKIEKGLDELDISAQSIDQSIQVLLQICEKEINALKDR